MHYSKYGKYGKGGIQKWDPKHEIQEGIQVTKSETEGRDRKKIG